jgi:hypothetical protein
MTHQFILNEDLNPLENLLKGVIYCVERFYYFIDKIMGLLGVVLLMPIFAVVLFVVWSLLTFSNWRLEIAAKRVFKEIKKANPRSIMLFHHAIKMRRMEADQIIFKLKPTSNFFLFKPLFRQVKVSRRIFSDAEERLHKTAYPHLYQPFSSEQKELLEQLSKNFDGVWEENDFVILK